MDDARNSIPRNHVPGIGPIPCRVMLIGEAPGATENSIRMPFCGQAGQELTRYLSTAGLSRDHCYITNLCKFWPPLDARGKQLGPSAEDIARDEPELLAELAMVQPEILVTIGAHASRYFLKDKFWSMRDCHGIPQLVRLDGLGLTLVVPTIHPAAGLHSMLQEEQARIQWDFQQVGRLVRGQFDLTARTNKYPRPTYRRLYDADGGPTLLTDLLAGRTEVAIDTEGTIEDPECLTITTVEGSGYMVESTERDTLAVIDRHINAEHANCTVILHYATHDIPVIEAMGIRIANRPLINPDGSPTLRDTMNELHLLGGIEPKGLKAAEWRRVGMESDSYEDVTKECALETSRDYLETAFARATCERCYGVGKIGKNYKLPPEPDCALCGGTGRVEGKRAGTTKQCSCVKSTDKCDMPECVDGLLLPLPPRELEFDSALGDFRWKQPQSIAKWLKRRLLNEWDGTEDEQEENGSPDDESEDGLSASVAPYFKLRTDWRKLPADRRALIERDNGRMPRVSLRQVKDQSRVTTYACADSDGTMRVGHSLTPDLDAFGLQTTARLDSAALPILSRMERNGMHIDRAHFEHFHSDLQSWLAAERDKLSQLVGERNPNSKRMIGVLFGDLGLPPIKLTATGQESTDDETLGILKAQLKARQLEGSDTELVRTGIAVLDCIQTYREFQKMDSTYVQTFLLKADQNDRVHTTINYTKSVSRLSSEDPNLQNCPNPDNSPFPDDPINNMGLRMRNGFTAKDGFKIIEVDYSAIEMVVGAHLTQDRNLMRVFHEGLDPHRYAASEFLSTRMEDVPKPVRTQFKTLNFAAFYDTSAPTIQRQFALMQPPIDKTNEECQALIDWYFSQFAPDVMEWKDRTRRAAQADGMVRTMFGRMRWIPGLRSTIRRVRSAAERECTNFPIQGTSRDILMIALANLWSDTLPALWAAGVQIEPIMTVHDAIAFECEEQWAEGAGQLIAETMRSAVELSVPVKVSVGIGDNWAEAH